MDAMTGALVVEGEPPTGVPDGNLPTRVTDPAARCRRGRRGGLGAAQVRRIEGVHRQGVLDVHQQQFLMLLLVV